MVFPQSIQLSSGSVAFYLERGELGKFAPVSVSLSSGCCFFFPPMPVASLILSFTGVCQETASFLAFPSLSQAFFISDSLKISCLSNSSHLTLAQESQLMKFPTGGAIVRTVSTSVKLRQLH